MEEDIYAFSTMRPRKTGKTIACVPYRFKIGKDSLGRKIVEPAGFPGLVEGHTSSGYLAFSSESELKAIMDELKMRFSKHGITNFSDVEKAVNMSKTYLAFAGKIEGKGKFSFRTAKRRKDGLIPMEAKSAADLEGVDWFIAAKLLSQNKGQKLKAWSVRERPDDNPSYDVKVGARVKKEEEEVSFGTPFDFIDMKGTRSLYEDMKRLFGEENVKLGIDFNQKGFTHLKEAKPLRRESPGTAGSKE